MPESHSGTVSWGNALQSSELGQRVLGGTRVPLFLVFCRQIWLAYCCCDFLTKWGDDLKCWELGVPETGPEWEQLLFLQNTQVWHYNWWMNNCSLSCKKNSCYPIREAYSFYELQRAHNIGLALSIVCILKPVSRHKKLANILLISMMLFNW